MNKNVLIVLGGAVVVAVLVALLVQLMIGGGEEQKPQEIASSSVQILVASDDLGIGKELEEGDLKWQKWPKDSLFKGAVRRKGDQSPKDALEGRLRRDVAEGEPVLKSYILKETKANFVAASLEPGMRAVSVQVSPVTMVSGFVSAGDFVDVVMTYDIEAEENDAQPDFEPFAKMFVNESATETLVQNVRVLAVDQTASRPEDGKIRVGKTVTIELTPKDAERVIMGQAMGDITLILRGTGDKEIVKRDWVATSDNLVIEFDDSVREAFQEFENTRIKPKNVRIYQGETVNSVSAY